MACQYPFGTMNVTDEAKELIQMALTRNRLTNGALVSIFEQKFADAMGTTYAVAVSSGTDANTLALASLYEFGADRGDEIIIPASTFVATANSVINAGFTPVFVDVDVHTLQINPDLIDSAITDRTRAIMPVHLMGKAAQMSRIMDIAASRRVNVIEDAAEAHGAMYRDQKVGTIGMAGCFSLYAAHIISSIEGGMIVTNSSEVYECVKSLRNHGLQLHGSNWSFRRIGFSSKMNELEAAVGIGNIKCMDDTIAKRRANFKYLKKHLDKYQNFMYTIAESEYERLSPHAFPIILRQSIGFTKDEFVAYLTECGIDNRNLFYSIPTQTDCYKYLGYKYGDFPAAEYLANNGTHIGIHQDLTTAQLDYAADKIGQFIDKRG